MEWREKFEQVQWDHFYILDPDETGVKKAKEEQRVKPAGDDFKQYILDLCLQVEREAKRDLHK